MKIDIAKNIISAFDKTTFRSFVCDLFATEYGKSSIIPSTESDLVKNYFHKGEMYIHYYAFDFFPYSIFNSLQNLKIDTNTINKQIEEIKGNYKKENLRLGDIYFINNLIGYSFEEYNKYISKQIWALTDELIDPHQEVGFGNIDTFFYKKEDATISFLENYIQDYSGVTISITDNGYLVNDYYNQNYLSAGVLKNNFAIINSMIVVKNKRNILTEFQKILNQQNSEAILEKFLIEHYKEIFGEKYNSIIPQVLLRFPELDINNKNRRLDIMLRNSISNDWEIFELKKEMDIVKNYRGVPTFKTVVSDSIQQLKNYSNLLKQDSVKRKLQNTLGIDYFVPEFNLVIGKQSDTLNNNQWRHLITSATGDIKIITYDSLYKEMSNRITEFETIFIK